MYEEEGSICAAARLRGEEEVRILHFLACFEVILKLKLVDPKITQQLDGCLVEQRGITQLVKPQIVT